MIILTLHGLDSQLQSFQDSTMNRVHKTGAAKSQTFRSSCGKILKVATLDSLQFSLLESSQSTVTKTRRKRNRSMHVGRKMCFLQKMSKVSFEDFVVEGLMQEGAWGIVYGAKRTSDGLPLALVCPFRSSQLIFCRNFLATPKIAQILWISPMKSGQCLS
jgi:hypothetical protein